MVEKKLVKDEFGSDKEIPRYLYRYEPNNKYNRENLRNHQFYFNSVQNLNDPFDCVAKDIKLPDKNIEYIIENQKNWEKSLNKFLEPYTTNGKINNKFKELIDNPPQLQRNPSDNQKMTPEIFQKERNKVKKKNLTHKDYEKIYKRSVQQIKKQIPKALSQAIQKREGEIKKSAEEIINLSYEYLGIVCFSDAIKKEKNEQKDSIKYNILMWSHYANNHKGFCLKFNPGHFNLVDDSKRKPILEKVKYSKYFPIIDYDKIPKEGSSKKLEVLIAYENSRMFCKKYKDWKYEQEWRLFHKKNEFVKYDQKSLTGIYFGTEMKKERQDELIKILQDNNLHHVKAYKGSKDKEKFKINFEQIK